jgi:hypothetical protein
MDCILGYHLNPLTCGVARFNRALGDQFGLPVYSMFSPEGLAAKRPLLSFKASEMAPPALDRLNDIAGKADIWPDLRIFFHDYSSVPVEAALMKRASKVYSGNGVMTTQIAPLYAGVIQAWCPGYLFERREFEDELDIKIYTFGMAHKLRTDYFHQLRTLLERSRKRYIVYISAAVHEDTALDDSFTAAYDELKKIFGDRVFFLGFVSDAALNAFLKECTYFAAFFQSGVRANSSSVSTAMQSGAVVLTNLDAGSPAEYRHLDTVVDIKQCGEALPLDRDVLNRIGANGKAMAEKFGWAPLLELMRREEKLRD